MTKQHIPRIPPGLDRDIDGTQLILSFKWNRSQGLQGVALSIAGLIFIALGALYLIGGTASWVVVVALLFYIPTGLLWGVASLADLLNVTTVRANLEFVRVTTKPIARGEVADTTIRVDDLEHVFARQFRHGPRQQGTIGHEVNATTRQGEDVTLVRGLRDRATARFIAQDLMRHLEIEA